MSYLSVRAKGCRQVNLYTCVCVRVAPSPIQIYDNQNIMHGLLWKLVNNHSLKESEQKPGHLLEVRKDLLTKMKLNKLVLYSHKQWLGVISDLTRVGGPWH